MSEASQPLEPVSLSSVVVAGAGGVIGTSVVEAYANAGVKVTGISRRKPDMSHGEHVSVDLAEEENALEGLAALSDTTHLVFAAYVERKSLAAQIEPNVALLANTLAALRANGSPLEHVTLYQGNKAYGAHLGPFKTPAKETDARLIGPNFYYDQEDLLRAQAEKMGFQFTILRPEAVMGYAIGNPMNLLMVLAAYASITKELGLPLRFPGTREVYDGVLYQMTDAELLAQATMWAGATPSAAGQIFNLTNGDTIRWSQLWRIIAAHFELDVGEPLPIKLTDHMPVQADLWTSMIMRHQLQRTTWSSLVDWAFGDFIFSSPYDNVSSTIKVRKAGFTGCVDTESRTTQLLEKLATNRVIPTWKDHR